MLLIYVLDAVIKRVGTLIARFVGPTWGPSRADRTQVGSMLTPWTLLSGQGFEFNDQGPFCQLGFPLIPAWLSNCIHNKVWVEIVYPFRNVNNATVGVWEWASYCILYFIGHMIIYLCWGLLNDVPYCLILLEFGSFMGPRQAYSSFTTERTLNTSYSQGVEYHYLTPGEA